MTLPWLIFLFGAGASVIFIACLIYFVDFFLRMRKKSTKSNEKLALPEITDRYTFPLSESRKNEALGGTASLVAFLFGATAALNGNHPLDLENLFQSEFSLSAIFDMFPTFLALSTFLILGLALLANVAQVVFYIFLLDREWAVRNGRN